MKKGKTGKVSPKKAIYIMLTMVLGGLLGCFIYGLLSFSFSLPCNFYAYFVVIGTLMGIPLGFYWWKVVYIEHRHWKKWCSKKK